MKSLRLRILALLGALPILLGLLVPAAAMPCAGGEGAPMSCDVCLVGILPGAPGLRQRLPGGASVRTRRRMLVAGRDARL